MTDALEGQWGPTVTGRSRRRHWVRYLVVALVIVALFVVGTSYSLYQVAIGNITKVDLPALTTQDDPPGGGDPGPLNVLVVGSDSRAGLTQEEVDRLRLGEFSGGRSDTVILVAISADRQSASVVSFPRDLLVDDDGVERKLTETFAGGPDNVVDVVQDNTGIPIHHYVEISIPGFISVVETVGGVDICLDAPLRDRKSGADFDAGCHDMSPEQALSYVRSRQTRRGDFDRMDRQQRFMKALLDRLVATRTLVDLPRLFSVVDRVSRNVTTDSGLGLSEMRTLAQELRGLANGTIPMHTVPSYAQGIDGVSYVFPYGPGAAALYARLEAGEALPSRGSSDDRIETDVAIWSGGNGEEADIVNRTLFWARFEPFAAGQGPMEVTTTTVYAVPGEEERAAWVATVLGTTVRRLPADMEPPDGAEVVVVVGSGSDATEED